jgi:hypothetical protein
MFYKHAWLELMKVDLARLWEIYKYIYVCMYVCMYVCWWETVDLRYNKWQADVENDIRSSQFVKITKYC